MNDISLQSFGINVQNFDPLGEGGFANWPDGWYRIVYTKAEQKPTQKTGAFMLVLTCQCIATEAGGDQSIVGKEQSTRLNLWNPNADAVRMASQELLSIGLAVGVYDVTAASVVLNKPLWGKFVNYKDKDDKPRGDFKEFKSDAGMKPGDIKKAAMNGGSAVNNGPAPAGPGAAPGGPPGYAAPGAPPAGGPAWTPPAGGPGGPPQAAGQQWTPPTAGPAPVAAPVAAGPGGTTWQPNPAGAPTPAAPWGGPGR